MKRDFMCRLNLSMSLLKESIYKAKEQLTERALLYLSGIALSALVWVGNWVDHHIAPPVLSLVSPQFLVRLLLSLLVILLLGLAYILLSRNRGLRLKFGIYWDKAKNPHCPVCKNPVSYGEYVEGFGYYCNPCSHVYSLSDASGKEYTPKDVQALL